jgi:hypothetical protein
MPATAPSEITYKPAKHAAEAKFVSLHRSLFNVFIFVPLSWRTGAPRVTPPVELILQ